MSNVVSIGLPRRPTLAQRQGQLLVNFARYRRSADDVYWLKENAEALNVLVNSGAKIAPNILDVFQEFYDGLEERLRFFPQYYRFLLSICLDLEALGIKGDMGQVLCRQANQAQLAAAELSDLQRAEARYLFSRGGVEVSYNGLDERLKSFADTSATFAVPNKKAAYELTHIVFYLTHYGAKSISMSEKTIASLEFAGLLAYLDQDIDLLSEVCVALRFLNVAPSDIWEDWLAHELCGFVLEPAPQAGGADAYHEYLVTSWWAQLSGLPSFPSVPPKHGMEVVRHGARKGPLRAISELMYQLGQSRTDNWGHMRLLLESALAEEHQHILAGAEQSSTHFNAFFQGFARAT